MPESGQNLDIKTNEPLPYIPPKIKPEKLFPDLTDSILANIEKACKENKIDYNRISKKVCGYQNGFIFGNEGLYGIYKEDKQQTHAAADGGRGKVKFARLNNTKEFWILKTQPIYKPNDEGNAQTIKIILNEHQVLTHLARTKEPLMLRQAKNGVIKAYILMRLEKGVDLVELIDNEFNNNHPSHLYPDLYWLQVAISIIKAFKALHKQKVLLRDVKLNNILFDYATGEAHIVDFGHAIIMGAYPSAPFTLRCIDGYNAPEIFNDWYGPKSEVYALSNILESILCHRYLPSESGGENINRDEYKKAEFSKTFKTTYFSDHTGLKDFLEKMRLENAEKRSSLDETLDFLYKLHAEYTSTESGQNDLKIVENIFKEAKAAEEERLKKAHQEIIEIQKKQIEIRYPLFFDTTKIPQTIKLEEILDDTKEKATHHVDSVKYKAHQRSQR